MFPFLALLLSLYFSFFSLVGYGIILLYFKRDKDVSNQINEKLFQFALEGLPLFLIVGLMAHFFFPLNSLSTLVIQSVGWLSCIAYFIHVYRVKKQFSSIPSFLFPFTLGLFLTERAMNVIQTYDSGLYHIQSVLWNVSKPITLGLVNLHVRFGFNSIIHVLSAELGLPKIWFAGIFSANTLLLMVVVGYFIEEVRKKSSELFIKIFAIVSAILLLIPAINTFGEVGSMGTDFPAMLLSVLISYETLKIINGRTSSVLLPLLLILPLIKMSYLPFAVVIFCYLVYRKQIIGNIALLFVTAVLGFLWLLRGFFLSGCMLYPIEFSCIQTPWTPSAESVTSIKEWIYSWARNPGLDKDLVLGNYNWVGKWIPRFLNLYEFKYLFWTTSLVILIRLVFKDSMSVVKKHAILFLGTFLNIVYWWITAPDARFISGLLLSMTITTLSFLCMFYFQHRYSQKIALNFVYDLGNLITLSTTVFILPTAFLLITNASDLTVKQWPNIPIKTYKENITTQGVKIITPAVEDQCWASALPCVPIFNQNISFESWHEWTIIKD